MIGIDISSATLAVKDIPNQVLDHFNFKYGKKCKNALKREFIYSRVKRTISNPTLLFYLLFNKQRYLFK